MLSTKNHLKLIFKAFLANLKKKKNHTVYHNVTQWHFDIQYEDYFFLYLNLAFQLIDFSIFVLIYVVKIV